MKKLFFFVTFLLLIELAAALNEDLIYEAEQTTTSLNIGSEIELSSDTSAYSISYMTANLSFIPLQRDNQKILSVKYDPTPEKTDDSYVLFKWMNPELGIYTYSIQAELATNINRNKVRNKVDFPIKNLAEEYEKYRKPASNIDSDDPEIVKIASQLAEGEDDSYIVVNKLVSWIKENIEYSLDTMTEKASQPASWVIRNKYGVCDEITSLFIAMARSLGIPARFVSGVAYTNWNNLNDWGPHAWAEVYYPGTGWVAYDITYNEFGYADATHIVMKESLDSNESSTQFGWAGLDINSVKLSPKDTNIKVKLLGKDGKSAADIAIKANPYKQQIGFGSYDIIEVQIGNLMDYYISEDISIAKVAEMETAGSYDQQIVLRPKETKTIYWLVKLAENLNKGYIYNIPIVIYSSRNISSRSSIESTDRYNKYGEDEMQSYINDKMEEEQKKYSGDITLNCTANEKLSLGDPIKIKCSIINEGNIFIENLRVCLADDCRSIDLGISKSAALDYEIKADRTGEQDYTIKASNDMVSRTAHVAVMVYDRPNVEIAGLEYNEKLKFGDELKLKFVLNKTSLSNPINTKISIQKGKETNYWGYGELKENQDFVISFDTNQMAKENKVIILVSYNDEKGNTYEAEKSITITIEADNFFDKIRLWLNKVFG
jgi:transglutaminase-like putative cysteine protease